MSNMQNDDYKPKWLKKIEPYVKLAASATTALAIILLIYSTCNTSRQVEIMEDQVGLMRKQWNQDRRPYIYMPTMECNVKNGIIKTVGLFENVGKSVASNVRISWVLKERESGVELGKDSSLIGFLFPGKAKTVSVFECKATQVDYFIKIRVDWTWQALNIHDSLIYDQIILNKENIDFCTCKIVGEKELKKIWGNFQL